MKLEDLRNKLRKSNKVYPTKSFEDTFGERKVEDINKLNKIFKNVFLDRKNQSISEIEDKVRIKLIGVTGSHGKSSVAYLIHSYLKYSGYKSVLYSSLSIDSPSSFKKKDEAVENPLLDEQMLLNAIEEACEYNADFLVLEVNERAIERGLTKEIPFDLRIITNINPTHNKFFYPNYIEIKKQFFKEVSHEDNVICLFRADDKEIFEDLYKTNEKQKVTYMSKYVMQRRGIDASKIDYQLTANELFDTINGLTFTIKSNTKSYDINTNMIFPHNGLNITCVVAALETLEVFDYVKFSEFIDKIRIPGVDEVYRIKNKTVIVTRAISPNLEYLYSYKEKNQINDIHIVMGTAGLGYKSWSKEFSDQTYINEKEYSVEFAYKYAEKYADKIYITVTDSGAMDIEELLAYQASFVKDDSKRETINNRSEAIKNAISSAKENDVIIITGRGNRRVMCIDKETRELHLDSDIIKQIIRLGEKD